MYFFLSDLPTQPFEWRAMGNETFYWDGLIVVEQVIQTIFFLVEVIKSETLCSRNLDPVQERLTEALILSRLWSVTRSHREQFIGRLCFPRLHSTASHPWFPGIDDLLCHIELSFEVLLQLLNVNSTKWNVIDHSKNAYNGLSVLHSLSHPNVRTVT